MGQIPAFNYCPSWLLDKYREAVGHKCTLCGKSEADVGKLTAHRLIRGHKGGKYTVWPLDKKGSNLKIICDKCHKIIHFGEF